MEQLDEAACGFGRPLEIGTENVQIASPHERAARTIEDQHLIVLVRST